MPKKKNGTKRKKPVPSFIDGSGEMDYEVVLSLPDKVLLDAYDTNPDFRGLIDDYNDHLRFWSEIHGKDPKEVLAGCREEYDESTDISAQATNKLVDLGLLHG